MRGFLLLILAGCMFSAPKLDAGKNRVGLYFHYGHPYHHHGYYYRRDYQYDPYHSRDYHDAYPTEYYPDIGTHSYYPDTGAYPNYPADGSYSYFGPHYGDDYRYQGKPGFFRDAPGYKREKRVPKHRHHGRHHHTREHFHIHK